jgi:hypothetical protein
MTKTNVREIRLALPGWSPEHLPLEMAEVAQVLHPFSPQALLLLHWLHSRKIRGTHVEKLKAIATTGGNTLNYM